MIGAKSIVKHVGMWSWFSTLWALHSLEGSPFSQCSVVQDKLLILILIHAKNVNYSAHGLESILLVLSNPWL